MERALSPKPKRLKSKSLKRLRSPRARRAHSPRAQSPAPSPDSSDSNHSNHHGELDSWTHWHSRPWGDTLESQKAWLQQQVGEQYDRHLRQHEVPERARELEYLNNRVHQLFNQATFETPSGSENWSDDEAQA